jgi:DNA repair protein RadC
MSRSCSNHRIPRGFIDPIKSRSDALAVLSLAAPFGDDTVAILLDPERRGVGILVVTGTTDPDAIFRVIDVCVHAQYTDVAGIILATSRPGGDLQPVDRNRWIEAAMQCDDAGVELVEWFIIGRRITCPRELAGDPPRWDAGWGAR